MKLGKNKNKVTNGENDKNGNNNKGKDQVKNNAKNKGTIAPTYLPTIYLSNSPSVLPTIATPEPSTSPTNAPSISDRPTTFPICGEGGKHRNFGMYYNIVDKVYGGNENEASNLLQADTKEHQVLCWLVHGEGTIVDPDDRNLKDFFALAFIYTQMGGKDWTNNFSWFSNKDFCTWHGLECYPGSSSIRKLSLCKSLNIQYCFQLN